MNAPLPQPDGYTVEHSRPTIDLERIIFHAVNAHKTFDTDYKKREPIVVINAHAHHAPSYHNANHIAGANRFLEIVLGTYGHNNDPFDLSGEYARYKEQVGDDSSLTARELRDAFLIAFSCHDLGNITQSAKIDHIPAPGHHVTLDFATRYQLGDPSGVLETRSADIAENLIREFSEDRWSNRESFIKFVRHIIMQTVFNPDNPPIDPPPFWTFVQVVDQIGASFFSDQLYPEALAGLLYESRINGKKLQISPRAMWTFPAKRLTELMPEERFDQVVPMLLQNPHGRTFEYFQNPPHELTNVRDNETALHILLQMNQ